MNNSMRLGPVVLLTILLLSAAPAAAQDTSRAHAVSVTLPEGGCVPGWEQIGAAQCFSEKNLYGYIDGGAELFLEFGFKELLLQRYGDHEREVALEVYVMENAAAALGIYLLWCGRETPVSGIGGRNSGDRYQINICRNNCYLLVNNFEGDSAFLPVMTVLAQQALKSIPDGEPVTLFDYLPTEDLIAGTERLIRGPYGLQPIFTLGEGDVLQLGGKIFAAVGDYRLTDSSRYTQIVVPYPGRPAASTALAYLEKHFDPYHTVLDRRDHGFSFQDFAGTFGSVAVRDSVLSILINLPQRPAIQ
jgi:hypothetical protein